MMAKKTTFEEVLKQNPDLSANGFRTRHDSDKDFARYRSELKHHCRSEVDAALRFLDGVELRKTMNPIRGSYGLKHIAEKHQYGYICNGAMIAALLMAGVPIRRWESRNVEVAISEKWLREREADAERRKPDQYHPPADWPHVVPGVGS